LQKSKTKAFGIFNTESCQGVMRNLNITDYAEFGVLQWSRVAPVAGLLGFQPAK